VIKQRLLRALQGAGVALPEIQPAFVIYPTDSPRSSYFHHSGPAVPVYWLTDEIALRSSGAIARYHGERDITALENDGPITRRKAGLHRGGSGPDL
jgi:hypothetical protein